MDFINQLRLNSRQADKPAARQSAVFDGLSYSAESDMEAAELSRLKIDVAATIAEWTETDDDDLDAGESRADRFDALMIGLADADKNGDLSDDELNLLDIAYNVAYDILLAKGVSEDDADAMLNEGDAQAAEFIHELLVNTAADGEDAELDEINNFAFDSDSDAAVMDAAYKRTVAIRNGKKTIIRKRISGMVRLTAKQKAAIRKAQRKAHSGKARMSRLKSMKKRRSMGL